MLNRSLFINSNALLLVSVFLILVLFLREIGNSSELFAKNQKFNSQILNILIFLPFIIVNSRYFQYFEVINSSMIVLKLKFPHISLSY